MISFVGNTLFKTNLNKDKMRYQPLSSTFYNSSRKRLTDTILKDSIIIIFSSDVYPKNGDQFYNFRQNSNLYHLCGVDQAETIMMLAPFCGKEDNREVLFVKKINEKQRIWNGEKYSLEEAGQLSGIKNVQYNDSFDVYLNYVINKAKNVYFLETPENTASQNKRRIENIKKKFPNKNYLSINEKIHSLRLVKDLEELAAIKKAVNITKDSYHRVLQDIKPSMMEYEVEAMLTYEFIKQGATGHAYEPIVASGKNACILHYITNDKQMKDGDLLLMDFGAEYAYYASDCSRTIPVNGKFNAKQKLYYQAVYDVFEKAKELYIPGNTINIINENVEKWMEEKMVELGLLSQIDIDNQDKSNPLFKKYFPHGTAHFIGLDVHDVGAKETIFEEGMVLSCEPGLYIEDESIGIRIETDMVVGEIPTDLMSDFPVSIEEIESAMAK